MRARGAPAARVWHRARACLALWMLSLLLWCGGARLFPPCCARLSPPLARRSVFPSHTPLDLPTLPCTRASPHIDPPFPPFLSSCSTVVGLRCIDGVVLGVENPFISKMVEPGSASRAYAAARHAGLAVGGVDADGRAIAGRAQAEAVAYKK